MKPWHLALAAVTLLALVIWGHVHYFRHDYIGTVSVDGEVFNGVEVVHHDDEVWYRMDGDTIRVRRFDGTHRARQGHQYGVYTGRDLNLQLEEGERLRSATTSETLLWEIARTLPETPSPY